MASDWVQLTSQQDDEAVYVNLSNASSIESHKKGARIWFLAGEKDGAVDVSETPDQIIEKLGRSKRD
jgi:hypothetical protein